MKLSIITTIYKSAGDIVEFYRRSVQAAAEIGAELELILVNDGSPDNGLEVARELAAQAPTVIVIDLSRNFGQARALWIGIRHSSGDLVAMLDGDLEEDPLWLADFHKTMVSSHCDVVYGVQKKPKGNPAYRTSRLIFYRLLTVLAAYEFPRNVASIHLMSRRFVDALTRFPEHEFYLLGMIHVTGFAQIGVEVAKVSRSPTTYTLGKLIRLFTNSVTSFSVAPLMFIAVCGLFLFVAATLFIFYLIVGLGATVPGWLSVMAALTFFSSVIILFLGVLAIYIATIFLEVKRRPVAIVREIIGSATGGQDGDR